MREVEPAVYLISQPLLNWDLIEMYLAQVDGEEWVDDLNIVGRGDPELLIEFAGRMCYRSWKPGLNPNVRKVRKDGYLANILKSGHGSVLEHANFTFVFQDVSRVFTHEIVRHRAGSAFSQESLRFVRLEEIPFWIPDWAREDEFLMGEIKDIIRQMENLQSDLAEHFDLHNPKVPFSEKKAKTSFMRRLAPMGLATSITWTANVRTIRHVIEQRTAAGAEEEIRMVFGKVAAIMVRECPELFGDFKDVGNGVWLPMHSKV